MGTIDIRWGSTLSSLAKNMGTSISELMQLNPQIQNPNLIIAGTTLNVPGDANGTTAYGAAATQSSSIGLPDVPVQGTVSQWIQQAMQILEASGVPASKINANDIATIIEHESGGNPNAINNWDSNAAAGHPSQGLMQTIPSTFDAYKLPGHDNILNPVDNIVAGVRYAISRYGSTSAVPGIVSLSQGGPYVGY